MTIMQKVVRVGKGQYKCSVCKSPCSAKDGDWFDAEESKGHHQVFVCHKCEPKFKLTIVK